MLMDLKAKANPHVQPAWHAKHGADLHVSRYARHQAGHRGLRQLQGLDGFECTQHCSHCRYMAACITVDVVLWPR